MDFREISYSDASHPPQENLIRDPATTPVTIDVRGIGYRSLESREKSLNVKRRSL